MIKPVESLPYDVNRNSMRQKQLLCDIEEIIRKRIEKCEISESGYAVTSLREIVMRAIWRVVARHAREKRLKVDGGAEAFRVHLLRAEDNQRHLYVTFDTDIWDEWMKGGK